LNMVTSLSDTAAEPAAETGKCGIGAKRSQQRLKAVTALGNTEGQPPLENLPDGSGHTSRRRQRQVHALRLFGAQSPIGMLTVAQFVDDARYGIDIRGHAQRSTINQLRRGITWRPSGETTSRQRRHARLAIFRDPP